MSASLLSPRELLIFARSNCSPKLWRHPCCEKMDTKAVSAPSAYFCFVPIRRPVCRWSVQHDRQWLVRVMSERLNLVTRSKSQPLFNLKQAPIWT